MAARSPGCLVVLLDCSQRLAEHWRGESFAKVEGVVSQLKRSCAELAKLGDFDVAILGYQQLDTEPRIRSLIASSADFVPASLLTGNCPVLPFEPAGASSQCAALKHVAELLENWCSRAPMLPAAPVVLHIITGPPCDGNPTPPLERIAKVAPCHGQPIVIQIHLHDGTGKAQFLPSTAPSDYLGRNLYRLSHPLGSEMQAIVRRHGRTVNDGCRGLVLQTSAAELQCILDCVTEYVSPWGQLETRILWRFPPDDPPRAFAEGRAHLIAGPDDQCFVAFGKRLYSLTCDGQICWSTEFPEVVLGGITRGSDNAVRVHTRDGLVSCIDAKGRTQWQQVVGRPIGRVAPVVDPFGHTLLLTHDGHVAAITPAGQLRSDYQAPPIHSPQAAILDGTRLYLGGLDQRLHAWELTENGAQSLWEPARGRCGGPVLSLAQGTHASTVFVAAADDCLYAFSPEGEQVWAQSAGARILSPLCATCADQLVFGSCPRDAKVAAYQLDVFDSRTGIRLTTHPSPAPVRARPAANENSWVVIGDHSGRLQTLDANGEQVWTKDLSLPIEHVAVLNRSLVLAATRAFLAACRLER